ncbi:Putative phosphoribosyl transferase [Mariniflexile rhizosphaerae]|uniref:dienelactone hydrolase family protein n=1 Tax=unclassified Mariniflexile TaxID=2643887 RepID=UPI000CBAB523|nr:alpha/beta hydrolase [Mariniflexile sp. TRM1-10]AXP82288.1 Putative phosphoribosyl transferase [Mariniflexile sp. TRM1-10]PLB20386.1 MAG: Dienelactone hydrolase [Flavobacteriaceae bacterium FS1-H7996/R]
MKTTTSFKNIDIPVLNVQLKGRLRIADNQKGMVIFSHGSGSGRLSSRNNYVAEHLQVGGFSSLLFDLLTEKEDLIYENRFDIHLLSQRLAKATQWLLEYEELTDVPVGYFGASTGAASALYAAAQLEDKIRTIVSRGGRPDLAMPVLHKIKAPTLLIVGGDDDVVIQLNKKAYVELGGIKKIEIIEGASHLFGEPGKLEEVADLSTKWFNKYLKK